VNVVLSDELEAAVRERITSGRYPDAEAVLADALAALDEREAFSAQGKAEAQRKIVLGLNQLADGKSLDGDAFFAELLPGSIALGGLSAGYSAAGGRRDSSWSPRRTSDIGGP